MTSSVSENDRSKKWVKNSSVGVVAIVLAGLLSTPAYGAPGTYDTGTDANYTEDDPAIRALQDFTLSDASQDYAGGNVTFSIDGSYESGETLSFATQTPSIVDDVISVQGTTVFKGNGTSANPIGNVDGTMDGEAADLKVNFSNAFENGDFENGSTGWTITNSRVNFGYIDGSGNEVASTSTIGGYSLPIDYTWGPSASDSTQWDRASAPNTFSSSTSNNKLAMSVSRASCSVGFCVVNGPIVISDSSVFLSAGDEVSFDWAAVAGGDAFNVYGYLLNQSTGKMLKLIDETGRDGGTASGTVNVEVGAVRDETGYFDSPTVRRSDLRTYSAGTTSFSTGTSQYDDRFFVDGSAFEAGNYRFVFVSGSYDDSGGLLLGATFTIDNISVSSAGGAETVTASDVQALARLLTYQNTTGINSSRTVKFASSNADTSSGDSETKIISVTQVNDVPNLATPTAISLTDTADVDTFSAITRSLSATDEEGDSITYGPASEEGTYGSISVTSDGTLTFTPDDEAINALDADASETFTVTASDGSATGTATLTVSITATVDTLPSAPTLGSITGANQSLSVVFSPPASEGSTAIENYKYSTDGTNYVAFDPAQTASPLTITALSVDGSTPLTNGVDIPITIKAVNSGGDSPSSNSVTAAAVAPPAPRSDRGDDDDEPAPVTTQAAGNAPVVVPPRRAVTPPQTNLPVTRSGPVLRNGVAPQVVRVPEARVGGVSTPVETTVSTQSFLTMRTGALSLGVQVPEGLGSINQSADGETEIAVQKGSRTTLSGSGLAPGSTVQVFLPLQGTNAKELTRIPVGPDGAFSGDAAFATAPNEAPLPVGRQVMQMVSLDVDGNEVVVDMTINIAQPAPAPEFNRVDGVIPTLAPGTSIATNAGVPEEVRVTAVEDQKLAVVEGSDWSMAVAVPAEEGAVEASEGGASIKLVRDESAQISGEGFMPGTRADVWLFSEPTLLGTVTIGDDGRFDGEVNIDGRVVTAGEHTLQMQGIGKDGYVRAANMGVVVDDVATEAASATSESSLAALWWALGAIVVLAAVGGAVALNRRRLV